MKNLKICSIIFIFRVEKIIELENGKNSVAFEFFRCKNKIYIVYKMVRQKSFTVYHISIFNYLILVENSQLYSRQSLYQHLCYLFMFINSVFIGDSFVSRRIYIALLTMSMKNMYFPFTNKLYRCDVQTIVQYRCITYFLTKHLFFKQKQITLHQNRMEHKKANDMI